MTVLSEKMQDDMQLRGLSVRTQESYVGAVPQLAKHYHKSPEKIDEEEWATGLFQRLWMNLMQTPANQKPASKSLARNAVCPCFSSVTYSLLLAVLHRLSTMYSYVLLSAELITRQFLVWLVLILNWQTRIAGFFGGKIASFPNPITFILCTIIISIGIVWVDHFFSITKNL